MRIWIVNLFLTVMLTACSSVANTSTPVITPSSTATPMPLPTLTATLEPTKDPYAIDKEKLFNFPASYEDVVANPENYVQVHDPLTNMDEFKADWDKIQEILGDQTQLEPNFIFDTQDYDMENWWKLQGYFEQKPLSGKPQFFYFKHNERLFPIVMITPQNSIRNFGTFAIILTQKSSFLEDDGLDAIKNLNDKDRLVRAISGAVSNEYQNFDADTLLLLDDGFNWAKFNCYQWHDLDDGGDFVTSKSKYSIGVGRIWTIPSK